MVTSSVASTAQHSLRVAQLPEGTAGKAQSPLDTSLEDVCSPIWWHTFTSAIPKMSEEEDLDLLTKSMLELSPSSFLPQLCLVRDFLPEPLSTNGHF